MHQTNTVDDDGLENTSQKTYKNGSPKYKEIVTITKINTNLYEEGDIRDKDLFLMFKEYSLPWNIYGFNSIYFKPLVEKKTDISIFTEMLTGTPVEQLERIKKLEKLDA